MMISTQKLSDLAFCVHDGMVKEEEKLTESQKKYALKYVLILFGTAFKPLWLLLVIQVV